MAMATFVNIPSAMPGRMVRKPSGASLYLAFGLFFSVVFGLIVALFGGVIGAVLGVVLAGAVLLFSPRATVWVTIVGGLAIAGLVELYLPAFQVVRWGFSVMSIVLAVVSAVVFFAEKHRSHSQSTDANFLLLVMLGFAMVAMASALFGGGGTGNAIVGLKNYFQMWGLVLALAWLGYNPSEAGRFIKLLGFLALIQMPFVLHQFIALVPLRSRTIDAIQNIVAVDIVAGTFGGDMHGGGRSTDLAILSVAASVLFFAQWKAGLRKFRSALFLSAIAFAPILFNEAKLALLLLPVSFSYIFRKTIAEKPVKWFFGSLALLAGMVVVFIGYSMLPGAASQRSKSVSDYINSTIEYNVGNRGYGGVALNRTTAYRFWLDEHKRTGNLRQFIFGHGVGFSNEANMARSNNPTAIRYQGYGIGLTGMSSLLWDVGVLGSCIFIFVLVSAFNLGGRLVKIWEGTEFEPTILTAQVMIMMLGISIFHSNYLAFDVGFQTLFAISIGYLLAMARSKRKEIL